jgi:hypothetical protein
MFTCGVFIYLKEISNKNLFKHLLVLHFLVELIILNFAKMNLLENKNKELLEGKEGIC